MPVDPSSGPSTTEVLQALAPIRMPADFAAFTWRDGLAAFSLGLLAALVLAVLLRPLFQRIRDPLAEVRSELRTLATKPFQERLAGQASMMVRLEADPPLEPAYREALYRPIHDDGPDLDVLDGRILKAAEYRLTGNKRGRR